MKFSEFQPMNEATPPVPAKPGPAQPAAKASAATAKMAPKPPVPAKPGPAQPAAKASAATAKMAPKPPVPGAPADMANRIGDYLSDVEAVDMPNAFTKNITSRNAGIVQGAETAASREIKAKLNVGAGANTAGLSPKQAAELKRQSLAARAEMNAPGTPPTDAETKALEKYAT